MTDIKYPTGPAALFHAAAVEVAPIFCEHCEEDTAEFVKDDGIYEIYQCPKCGIIREVAVR